MFSTTSQQIAHVRASGTEEKLDYLLDHIAVADVVQRYGEATDTHDFALLRTCYGETIDVDHSPTIGMGRMTVRADAWCDLADRFHSQLDGDEHILVPQGIVIHGDTAACRVLMHASHFYRAANGSPFQSLVGAYRLEFVRTPDGWKIARSVQEVTWAEGNWQFHEAIKESLGTPNLR